MLVLYAEHYTRTVNCKGFFSFALINMLTLHLKEIDNGTYKSSLNGQTPNFVGLTL